jgi:hypothetical protein
MAEGTEKIREFEKTGRDAAMCLNFGFQNS